ncbi:hypothetical protein BH10PSE12_BH10PSE12_02530 [soil metagenome]
MIAHLLPTSMFQATSNNPFHLSVGAIVRDDAGLFVLFRKGAAHAFMTETVEARESVEDAVHRGLMEEMGATATIQRYCGSSTIQTTDHRGPWQKTVLWFECTLGAMGGPSDIPDWEIVHLESLDGVEIDQGRWPLGLT